MLILLVVSKISSRRSFVKLSTTNRVDLQRAIETLRAPKEERKHRQRPLSERHVDVEHSGEQANEPPPSAYQNPPILLEPVSLTTDVSSRVGSSQSSAKPGDENDLTNNRN